MKVSNIFKAGLTFAIPPTIVMVWYSLLDFMTGYILPKENYIYAFGWACFLGVLLTLTHIMSESSADTL